MLLLSVDPHGQSNFQFINFTSANQIIGEVFQLNSMSNLVYLSVFFLVSSACASSQSDPDPALKVISKLPGQLKECSGMVAMGEGLYLGHNDSGNTPDLILFTLGGENDVKRIRINNATNVDWEALATDDEYVYIGDTGNNNGTRKDLAIYKVKKEDILSGLQANAEKIMFSYPEQKKFKSSNTHNFDCEAMVCVGDSLYLFTKNRANEKSDVYGLPKIPGPYNAKHHGSIEAGGLITGADSRMIGGDGHLVLVGYMVRDKGYHPFLLYFDHFTIPGFFKTIPTRYTFSGKLQTETVLFEEGASVLVSNEEEHGDLGYIYRVNLNQ
jgi:hypothetical protein